MGNDHHLSIFVAGLWQLSKQIMRSMLVLLVMALSGLLFGFGIVGLMEGFWLFSVPHGPYWVVWGSRASGIIWVYLFFYLLYRHVMRLGQERIRISHEKDT